MPLRRPLTAALTLSLALAAAGVGAQPVDAVAPSPATVVSARAAFQRGVAHLNAGRYADALLALEESYRLNPVAVALMNMGIAHQGLHHDAEAVEHLERYLRDANTQVPPARAREVRATVTELRRNVATIQLAVRPPDFEVTVDGVPRTVLAAEVVVNPGHRVVVVNAPGRRPMRREFDLVVGSRVILDATLEPEEPTPAPTVTPPPTPVTATPTVAPIETPAVAPITPPASETTSVDVRPPPQPVEASRPVYTRWWFWTIVGVGVAGVATGLAIALRPTQAPLDNLAFTVTALTFR